MSSHRVRSRVAWPLRLERLMNQWTAFSNLFHCVRLAPKFKSRCIVQFHIFTEGGITVNPTDTGEANRSETNILERNSNASVYRDPEQGR